MLLFHAGLKEIQDSLTACMVLHGVLCRVYQLTPLQLLLTDLRIDEIVH